MREALLYTKLDNHEVKCQLCAHECLIKNNSFGICRVRKNIEGVLYTLVYGEVIASHVDPIEKKPLNNFLPGTNSFSIATVGCNFQCSFCQNWQISQAAFNSTAMPGQKITPIEIVEAAVAAECESISYTYTEPTVYFELAYDTARLARQAGLKNIFVTNGFMTKQAIDMISPYLDACNIDLKSFDNNFYSTMCKASLEPVLAAIKYVKEKGIWVEVTTLLIPGKNDSEKELQDIAEFITCVGDEIPWHISRYRPEYQYKSSPATSLALLRKAQEIGKNAGLKYVYLGNVLEGNNTYCYACDALLIERDMFKVRYLLSDDGLCPQCGSLVHGLFVKPE